MVIFLGFFPVVVIGFEKDTYAVFEGQPTEVCVAVLNRTLTNDVRRDFTVSTLQLTENFAIGMYYHINIPMFETELCLLGSVKLLCVTYFKIATS